MCAWREGCWQVPVSVERSESGTLRLESASVSLTGRGIFICKCKYISMKTFLW